MTSSTPAPKLVTGGKITPGMTKLEKRIFTVLVIAAPLLFAFQIATLFDGFVPKAAITATNKAFMTTIIPVSPLAFELAVAGIILMFLILCVLITIAGLRTGNFWKEAWGIPLGAALMTVLSVMFAFLLGALASAVGDNILRHEPNMTVWAQQNFKVNQIEVPYDEKTGTPIYGDFYQLDSNGNRVEFKQGAQGNTTIVTYLKTDLAVR